MGKSILLFVPIRRRCLAKLNTADRGSLDRPGGVLSSSQFCYLKERKTDRKKKKKIAAKLTN